ncbi:lysine histidine transporter-like 8 [Selaginella moellendorffii]|nr:lysine histidine transporter-like 8 [Selaginella moellendorffii]|eukprot:XP_002993599.2 lysine histidine transporter-like 8 [Selaginella moellendorffii]
MEDRSNLLVHEVIEREVVSIPATPNASTPPLTPTGSHWASIAPPFQGHTPSSGMLTPQGNGTYTPTPSSTRPPSNLGSPARQQPNPSSRLLRSPKVLFSPIGTPMRKALTNMRAYLEDIGHITKLDPQEAWLPITASRNGNAYYSAFHNLNASIGFQALLLPVALTFLGWTWGVLALVAAFIWQLYTLWILIQLHEAVPGKRHSRYVELAQEAFGPKLGAWLAIFPVVNLSGGTATGLIIIGGGTLELFYRTVCRDCHGGSLTTVEWYLVFTILCAILAQLPNLNSIAGVSLVGAVMAVAYTTLVWTLSISRPRPPGITYDTVKPDHTAGNIFSVLNALGIIAFAFRGHNLVLEIQGTMPSSLKHPAKSPMWRGAKVAFAIVAACYFPIAIAGYWAYGRMMLPSGILFSMYALHPDIPSPWMAITFLFVVLNSISSFQIYSMPMFDAFEQSFTARKNKPTPLLARVAFRLFFTFFAFFVGVALPFISSFAGLLGGLTSVPVTFCYPCFMWLKIKKPPRFSFTWYLNWTLGILGIVFSITFTAGGIWSIVDSGLTLNFFNP